LQTRTRRTFWDKMHLAKDIELPLLDWDKVEWWIKILWIGPGNGAAHAQQHTKQ